MTKRLTAKVVEQATPGPARREVPDGLLPGLFLVIQPSGRRSWCVRYRHGGKTRKLTLGGFPALDLAAARETGAAALRAVAQGRDPAGEKQSAKIKPLPVDTVDAAVERFIAVHAKRNMRPRSAREAERAVRKIAARWRGRRLADIAPSDLIELLDAMIETPVMANRALAYVKLFFNWCRARGMVATSPADGIKRPHKERARERTLSDHELFRIWRASEQLDPVMRGVLRILILTGQRRREVSEMRWHELDLHEARWVLPGERVKNGRQHTVPLSIPVLDILSKIPRVADCPFVFTLDGKTAIADLDRRKQRLDQIIAADGEQPLVPWVLHDARRSVATGMARIGIQVPVIERALNHVSGSFRGVTGTYQRHPFADEVQAALHAWARHIEVITSGQPAKVIALAARALP
jgi:integrase